MIITLNYLINTMSIRSFLLREPFYLPEFLFLLGWFWWLPLVQHYKSLSIVTQALCLPDLIPWIYLSPPLYNHKRFDLGHTWMAYWFFSTFFNLCLNFAINNSWSEPQSAPSLIFTDCIELLHLLLQKNIINLISVLTIQWSPCIESSLVFME